MSTVRTRGPRWTLPGEVYGYRTRKPGAIFGVPFLGRHWGYVGQSRNIKMRHEEHMRGGGRYGRLPASWSDLEPKRVRLFRLPWCPQWLLNTVEVFFILILWPVYNHRHNLANLRRISIARAKRARVRRDVTGIRWSPVPTIAHLIMGLMAFAAALGVWAR